MYRAMKTQSLGGADEWIVVDNVSNKNAIGYLTFQSRDIATLIANSMYNAYQIGRDSKEQHFREKLEELFFKEKQEW